MDPQLFDRLLSFLKEHFEIPDDRSLETIYQRLRDGFSEVPVPSAEGIANAEVRSLLEFARNEESESTTQNLKRSKMARAQYLTNQGQIEEAIDFLKANGSV